HWFVCYHLGEEPVTGSLEISKTVVPPVAQGAVVPTSFSVHIDCDSADFDRTVSEGSPVTITGLPDGDVCVVTEDTSSLPTSSAPPVYDPVDADTTGVTIVAGDTAVTVGITNDFSEVAGEAVVAPVTPAPAPVVAPARFTG